MCRAWEAPVKASGDEWYGCWSLASLAQGLGPLEWRPAGHPEAVMAAEPQTVAEWGLGTQGGENQATQHPICRPHRARIPTPNTTAKRGPGLTSCHKHLPQGGGNPKMPPFPPASRTSFCLVLCPLSSDPHGQAETQPPPPKQWVSPSQPWSSSDHHVHGSFLPTRPAKGPLHSPMSSSCTSLLGVMEESSVPSSHACPVSTPQPVATAILDLGGSYLEPL